MWIKALVPVVFFAGLSVVIGCNRADGVRPRSNNGPGPGDSSNTLSVAYAEVGDFDQAIRWQRKALEDPPDKEEEGENAREKLALYGKLQPFRE